MRAGVTQLAECLLPKQNVDGSNPFTRSSYLGSLGPAKRREFCLQGRTRSHSNLHKAEEHEFGHQEAPQGHEQA
jgi:hypothetical protein